MTTQSLNNIVNVAVTVSPVATARSGFNLGLIIGKSTVISVTDRVKIYGSTTEMKGDGWVGTEPEYLAAQIYFSQAQRPRQIAIGRWDGTGAETAVQAVTACRSANTEWYACIVIDATKTEIIAIAAYIESATPSSTFFYTTSDLDVPLGTAGNIFETLKNSSYKRSIGQYSTDNSEAIVAIMGYAMGANTGFANSAYTLAYKQEVGIQPESITATELTHIKNNNGNVYTNYGATYNLFIQGKVANGTSFDEIINLDKLVNDIQLAVMDALVSSTKIPQTEGGVGILISTITGPCDDALNIGFIAPGIWLAPPILNLETGDTLSKGYIIQAETVADQTQADRDARKAPNIYACVKLAGAIEYVSISIQVNR